MDILSSQATVAGYKAALDAANNLPGFMQMFMSAAGTIKPAKVLVLGAGVAGLQAIATAKRLGAVVEAFDVRSAAGEEVRSLGAKFIEVEGARDESSAGGYAVKQSEEYNQRQQQTVHNHAVKSGIIICTAQIPGKKAPVLIRKETVEQMIPGAVIIDLAASTGGNCELTKNNEVIMHNRVKIIGRSDYPSDLPVDASRMFGKNVLNFIQLIIDSEGKLNLNFEDDLVKGTCLTHNKEIVNDMVKKAINS
jgi:NAD(P) transhydrogenase subunit alpha